MESFGYSVIGPRNKNEDFYTVSEIDTLKIFCVADGVGGNACGDVASRFAVQSFIRFLNEKPENFNLKDLLFKVNRALIEEGHLIFECRKMATTFSAIVIHEGISQVIHTGDSRIYLLRNNGIKQLTEDHTEVKRLLRQGLLSKEQAEVYPRQNILDSALGIEKDLLTTHVSFNQLMGDRILLSTDGFYNSFSKVELKDMSIGNTDFASFSQALVNALNGKKLKDNATFLAIQV